MTQKLEIIESKECIELINSINNKIYAKIYLNENISKNDANKFLKDIKKHVDLKQNNSLKYKMKKVNQEMQECNSDLDKLYKLYDSKEDKFEKELIFAEIRSIEILNTIKIDSNGE